MVNDMTIIYGFLIFFTLVGFIAPFMNAEFSDLSIAEYNVEDVGSDIGESDFNAVSGWSVFLSVIGMSIWSFGSLPLGLELIIFLPIRLIFWLIVARNIWIGGGG